MAKGSKSNRGQRGHYSTPSYYRSRDLIPDPVSVLLSPFNSPYVVQSPLSAVEDHRLFHPDRVVIPDRSNVYRSGVTGGPARRSNSRAATFAQVDNGPGVQAFANPKSVNVCVRRHQRREVIFALGKSGRGARAPRRRNQFSNVRC